MREGSRVWRADHEAIASAAGRNDAGGGGSWLATSGTMQFGRRALIAAAAGGVVSAIFAPRAGAATRLAAAPEAAPRLEPPALKIPPRDPAAAGASAIFEELTGQPLAKVQARLAEEILAGNLPSFLRKPRPVPLDDDTTVWALSDYLAIGSDDDHLWVPLAAPPAQQVADAFGGLLPTPQIVDAIHAAADVRLPALGLNQPVALGSLLQARVHARMVAATMARQKVDRRALLAGHKKDVVITPALTWAPGKVAIYGFHGSGRPIQPLSTLHIVTYVDYSHGVRLLADAIDHGGVRRRLSEVLGERAASRRVSPPGPIVLPAYPASWAEAEDAQRRAWAQGT